MFWALLLVVAFVGGVHSDCCYAACQSSGSTFTSLFVPINVCADCSRGTPYCGYGRCNLAGCDCDNGCRTGDCSGRAHCLAILSNFVSQDKQG
uniref:Uncharacterized protein n=1 Tax=Romanomermis culicivorax TaxID=13658 RepID=A0A915JI74_ROMCU